MKKLLTSVFLVMAMMIMGGAVSAFADGTLAAEFVPSANLDHYEIQLQDASGTVMDTIKIEEPVKKGYLTSVALTPNDKLAKCLVIGYDQAGTEVMRKEVKPSIATVTTTTPAGTGVKPLPMGYKTVNILVNGKTLPYVGYYVEGTNFVDFEKIITTFGTKVVWNPTKTVSTVTYEDKVVVFDIAANTATVNGQPYAMKTGFRKQGSELLISARDLADIFGFNVRWYGPENTLAINAPDYKADPKQPYFIHVDKSDFLITVYEKDDFGKYSIVAKKMPTAIGKTDAQTPVGMHEITAKEEWHAWSGGYYTHWSTMYAPGLYFHSPLYNAPKPENIIQSSIDEIGTKSTSGCLKTSDEDSKWVYDNCPIGTQVEIVR